MSKKTIPSDPVPTDPVSKSLARRGAGRPSANALQGEELREHVISTAAQVYGQYGYRDTSVALITKAAGISRPLFYRLFKNCREVIDTVVARANESLFMAFLEVSSNKTDLLAMLSAGIDAYFVWCRSYGAVVGPIYRELNDPESPASVHRNLIVEKVMHLIQDIVQSHGYPRLDPLLIDTLLRTVEHIGSTTFWPEPQTDEVVTKNRAILQRLVMATVARPEDQHFVPSLESVCS